MELDVGINQRCREPLVEAGEIFARAFELSL